MTLFLLILSFLVNILLLGALIVVMQEKEYWAKKWLDDHEEMCPIQWDYTKERGWIDEEK